MKEIKIKCLHCYQTGNGKFGENHSCIWEMFDLLAREIVDLKETQCGNSGLNWNDYYEHLKEKIINHENTK